MTKLKKIFVTHFGLQKELRQTKMVFLLMELHGRPKVGIQLLN